MQDSLRFFPRHNPSSGRQVTGLIELIYFVRENCNAKVWCEIGSFIGESALIIASFPFIEKIHCVDIFSGKQYHEEFLKRTSHLNNKFEIHKCKSEDFHNKIPDESVDVIYIDGDHSYDTVKKDLDLALRIVKNNGFICGHDYFKGQNGVCEVVDKFVIEQNFSPLKKFCDCSFAIKKQSKTDVRFF